MVKRNDVVVLDGYHDETIWPVDIAEELVNNPLLWTTEEYSEIAMNRFIQSSLEHATLFDSDKQ